MRTGRPSTVPDLKLPKEPILCTCGCGGEIEIKFQHKYEGIPKYILGHNGCIFKGKSYEDLYGIKEAKRKKDHLKKCLSGREFSETTKHLFSEAQKRSYANGRINGMKGRIGSNHPNWRGGLSNYPYAFSFNAELRSLVRKRDNDTCQLCGRNTKEDDGRVLSVHHIDYDKQNCNLENLITLCRRCNSKVNFNREFWEEFLGEKLCA